MTHPHSHDKPFFYEPSQSWCCGECGQSGIEPTVVGMLKRAIVLIEDDWEGTSESTEGMKWLRDARAVLATTSESAAPSVEEGVA